LFSKKQLVQELSSLSTIRCFHQGALEEIEIGFRGFLGIGKLALLQSRPPQQIGDGTPARCLDNPERFCRVA